MAKILRIQDDPHYADYAVQYAEMQTPPLPDFKAARRKTIRSFLFDALCVGVAIFAVYFVSRI